MPWHGRRSSKSAARCSQRQRHASARLRPRFLPRRRSAVPTPKMYCGTGVLPLRRSLISCLLPQLILEHLHTRVAGQGIDGNHSPRHLEVGDLCAGPVTELALTQVGTTLGYDEGGRDFTHSVVGYADDGNLSDGGVGSQDAFDLGGVNIEATDHDDVLLTVGDTDEPSLIHHDD